MALERLRVCILTGLHSRVSNNLGWNLFLEPLSDYTFLRGKEDGRGIELKWVASHDRDVVKNESVCIPKKLANVRFRLID